MLCVVSHDAGGAEVLASYVARQKIDCRFVLEGPARAIFERRLGAIASMTLESALVSCEQFLCGTGWQSTLEWRALRAAKAAGKRSTAFLDHWVNYRERFIRNGVECLPDEIWVGDGAAEKLARMCFSATPVRLVPNPYYQDLREQLSQFESYAEPFSDAEGLRVLYVCEPIGEHALKEFGDERYWGYTELDALRYFFANTQVLGKPIDCVVLRPHPAEACGKYDGIVREFGAVTCLGGEKSLLREIAECDVVVGCASMAMVVGLVAGRRVISCIPPGGFPCVLPQPEIESLQILVKEDM